jgi:hypothetical protein
MVRFALDACDREIMAWSATTDGVSGAMVRATALGLRLLLERQFEVRN